MLIKIEDFPQGKTIKHITIDISFNEDGTQQTLVKHDYVQPIVPVAPPVYGTPYVATSFATVSDVVQHIDNIPQSDVRSDVRSDVLITRLATTNVVQQISAIPDEMRDIQF